MPTRHNRRPLLEAIRERMPFPVRAIQVDGGSEFKAESEAACQQMDIRLFVIPPKPPKPSAHVERAQRTDREEFYELTSAEATVSAFSQAFGCKTPAQLSCITESN